MPQVEPKRDVLAEAIKLINRLEDDYPSILIGPTTDEIGDFAAFLIKSPLAALIFSLFITIIYYL